MAPVPNTPPRPAQGMVRHIPNALTGLRVLLIPVFLNLLLYGYTDYALAAFVVAALSDAVDGAVARLTGSTSELGATIDPLADKMLALSAFAALTILGGIPLWLTLTVITRDVVIVSGTMALYFMGFRPRIRPYITGKLTTFLQMALVVAALAGLYLHRELSVKPWLVWLTLVFTVASGVQYVMRGLSIANRREEP